MCRVLFAVGDGDKMVPLVEAIVRASENDPYKEARGRGSQHRDGWGYVLLEDGSVRHYRSVRPVFEDEPGVEGLVGSLDGFSVLLVHTRAASQGSKGLLNTQPFALSSAGFSCWLYHNGDLNKSGLLERTGFDKGSLEKASDSYVMALHVCGAIRSVERDELLRVYSSLMPLVNTSLNTGSLFLGPDWVRGFITAYSRPEYLLRRENWDYVRQMLLRSEDLFAVASSTLELYHRAEWSPLRNGTALYLEISPGEESFTVEELVMG